MSGVVRRVGMGETRNVISVTTRTNITINNYPCLGVADDALLAIIFLLCYVSQFTNIVECNFNSATSIQLE